MYQWVLTSAGEGWQNNLLWCETHWERSGLCEEGVELRTQYLQEGRERFAKHVLSCPHCRENKSSFHLLFGHIFEKMVSEFEILASGCVYIATKKPTEFQPETSSSDTARPQVITSGHIYMYSSNSKTNCGPHILTYSSLSAQILLNFWRRIRVHHIFSQFSGELTETLRSPVFYHECGVVSRKLRT